MLRWFQGDLHIHTVLSPCAELSMGPRDIVRQALFRGLDFIAITDHNATANVAAVMNSAASTSLQVIPGVEVATREDIHMICLFPNLQIMSDFQSFIDENMTPGENDVSLWGPQLIVDADENIVAEEPRLLSLPLQQGYQKIVAEVSGRGGIVYPAHIDRKANSMVKTLGFLPSNLPFNLIELSRRADLVESVQRYESNGKLHIVTASDAHDLSQLGSAKTFFKMEAPTFPELYLACTGCKGRSISVLAPEGEAMKSARLA